MRRDRPFGAAASDSKRSFYRISDPFLRFWFRFVAPNRSLLEARRIDGVATLVEANYSHFVGSIWEELVRACVPRSSLHGLEWGTAHAWWGTGLNRKPMELDLVAESIDQSALLPGSAKWEKEADLYRIHAELVAKGDALPFRGKKRVLYSVWLKKRPARVARSIQAAIMGPKVVLDLLR